MKRILLTGATGFLGSHLLRLLIDGGFKVVILKRRNSDISRISRIVNRIASYDLDTTGLDQVFREHEFDIVIHTATNYGRSGGSASEVVTDNVVFPLRLLQLSVGSKVGAFVNTDTLQEKFLSYYTLSKSHFTDWLFLSREEIEIVNIKIEHMYGPLDSESRFVVWMIKQLHERADSVALTHGFQKRDFVYINDVSNAFSKIVETLPKGFGFNEYEVGTGQSIAMRDVVRLIIEVFEDVTGSECDTRINFGEIPIRQFEPSELRANISRLLDLGWKPTTTLREGIAETVRWYQNLRSKRG